MDTTSEDQDMQKCTINHSIPPIHEDNLRLWLQTAPKSSSIYSNSGEISCLEDAILYGIDNAQSSNNHTIKPHGKESCEAVGEECKRQKRPRSTQDHNLNERLRRKKLTEKMTTLQEMIPNSVKKDQASTIDDAIKYIKTLQCQVQMMSGEAGHTLFHSPVMMVPPQLGQQGFQIPNLAPFLPTGGNGMCMGNELCLGMSNLLSSSTAYPIGLTNPFFIQSPPVGLGLATANSIQDHPSQLFELIDADNIPCFVSQLPIDANGEACPSQDNIRRVPGYS